jgi:predicted permease
VLTLALGIGATTVMFALVNGVLLRRQPIRDQERLIVAWKAYPTGGFDYSPFSKDDIEAVARENRLFEQVGGLSRHGAWPGVPVEREAESPINATCVTGSFFATLGVAPVLGRALEPADDVVGAEKVLVISHALWQRRYGGSPDVIGRRVPLSDPPFRIVGVMPPELDYPVGVEAWMTIEAQVFVTGVLREAVRKENVLLARLRPGVTPEQARQELQALVTRLDTAAGERAGLLAVVRSFDDVVVGDVRPAMLVLLAAVALLLLIACANTANLMLVRGESRRSELAVRAALGASGGALARPLLAESLLIALAAGLVGLAAARGALPVVLALVPGGLPRLHSVHIDAAVVFFAAAIAFVAAALAGVVPALYAARTDVALRLRTGRSQGGEAGGGRRVLVVAQVALAVAVVAAAGLLTRSLWRLQGVSMGLDPARLVVATLAFAPAGERLSPLPPDFHHEVVSRLRAIPGVESATPVNNPPLAGVSGWDSPQSTAEGQTRDAAQGNPSLNLEAVYPDHFETLGVALRRGRAFTEADGPGAPPVAIVSADVAQRLWPNQDAIGKRMRIGIDPSDESWARWRTVVGVVEPTRYRDLAVPRPTLYLPAVQFIETPQAYLMRTALPAAALAGIVRGRVEAVHSRARVLAVAPFRQYLQVPLARPRFNAFVIGLFAGASLLLAAVGLYAVMAAAVRQRHQEIGIRVAVGATARHVRTLVLGEALRLAAAGAAIGLGLAIAGARLVRGLLFSVHPLDTVSLGGAAVLLVAVSILACALPVRYATRVDPMKVLRA